MPGLFRRKCKSHRALLLVLGAALGTLPLHTQQAAPIDSYIHNSWNSLQRSMTECKSLVDPKTNAEPLLYLPQELPEPPAVHALQAACGVRVQRLPKRIDHPGALRPEAIPTSGLLYLPHSYVVPGGRFNEMYGWDSYFILLGLEQDGRRELARGMVENFFFEIEHYGNLLNANRTYFLTRSQPPLLSSMIRLVYKTEPAADRDQWLATAYEFAVKDHALWLGPEHRAGDTGLARYHDLGEGPVPEMADASTYYPDIIRWLLKHPEVKTDDLVQGPALAADATPTAEQAAAIARVSCSPGGTPGHSKVCVDAHVGDRWLTPEFYRGDRAMRESGFDTTFRFGPFSGSTDQFAPVCLNALLYKYELDLAWMAERLGKPAEAAQWKQQSAARKNAMDKYLWNGKRGLYFDYNYVTRTASNYPYITTFYPLWAGAADPAQAKAVTGNLAMFLRPGGVAMSTETSGVQWDLPYGWAPTNWFAVAALERSGADGAAHDLARRFMGTVKTGYTQDGTIREKYNVASGDADVQVSAGYKQNVIGFGWTNGVYLRLQQLLASPEQDGLNALGVTP